MEIQFRQDDTSQGISLSYNNEGEFFLEVFNDKDNTGMDITLSYDELELIKNCINHILKKEQNNE
jgi:hypothetical protein